MFIVNLAFSDLCMYITQSLPLFINTLYSSTWMYGALGCKVYACVGGIFGEKVYMITIETQKCYLTSSLYFRDCIHWIYVGNWI